MANETVHEQAARDTPDAIEIRGFRMLEEAGRQTHTTVRDDQQEFAWLLDAARVARGRGRRFRIVDSGKLDAFSLEWLAAAGADLYTADDIRADLADLVRIRRAGRASGASTVLFHHGPLDESLPSKGLSPGALQELLRSGVDIHLSNREKERRTETLVGLADSHRAGTAVFVYYHHGPLIPEIGTLAEAGAWVHIEAPPVDLEADSALVRDICRACRQAGAGLVIHLEEEISRFVLTDFRRAGAYLLSKVPAAGPEVGRPLPYRSYYLDTTFMP